MSLFLNGVETNTVMLNGVDTTGVWNGEVVWGVPPFYTLTLQTDGHGTLTANTLTGYPGDTITLTPTYNTYYRFNNYSNTGGSIAGNVFTFGDTDATAKANFKVNAFTASGGFEKGSNVTVTAIKVKTNTMNINKYAITGYKTSNVPASWYATSNRWNPSNASAYKITVNARMHVWQHGGYTLNTAYNYFSTNFGSTKTNTAKYTMTTNGGYQNADRYYTKNSITSNTQGNCSISSYNLMYSHPKYNYDDDYCCCAKYIAAGTSGTWTATGYAP